MNVVPQLKRAKSCFSFMSLLRSGGPAPPAVTILDVSSEPERDAPLTEPARVNALAPPPTSHPPILRRALSDCGPSAPPKKRSRKSKRSKRVRFAEEPEIRYFSVPPRSLSAPTLGDPYYSFNTPKISYQARVERTESRRPLFFIEDDDLDALFDVPPHHVRDQRQSSNEDGDVDEEEFDVVEDTINSTTTSSCATSCPIAIPRSRYEEFDTCCDLEPAYRTSRPFASRDCKFSAASAPVRTVDVVC
ncbi:hypothetical protein OE88DRAFT_180974 [Heliocybe sulcata]|uniref:Uncharacterized protein n=1 Tax=Heliocybe sulcata TaxID=5364 RepID=A0A5C3NAF2_9AGAM|nr:hypothetical protein OE88DRAFT_180974 [Heliocybe sulcata]